MSVFGPDCVIIIFSFKYLFLSLTGTLNLDVRPLDLSVLQGVNLINSFVSSQ